MSRNLSPADLNVHALTDHVDKVARDAWIATVEDQPEYLMGKTWLRIMMGIMMSMLVLPILAFFVVMIAGAFTGAFFQDGITPAGAAGLGVGLLVTGFLLFGITFGVVNFAKTFTQWTQWYRLRRFADANGFDYAVTTDPSKMPGTIATGSYKVTRDEYFKVPTEPPFHYGSVTRHTRNGKHYGSESWAFIEFRTTQALPQMMLEVKGSDTRNAVFWGDQEVPLDPEFKKRFTLYAADGTHDAAREMFSPDLLRLIDETSHRFNIEIINDRIVFHSSVQFNPQKPKEHELVMRIANTVGRRALETAASVTGDGTGGKLQGTARTKGLRRRYTVGGTIVGVFVLVLPFIPLIVQALTEN